MQSPSTDRQHPFIAFCLRFREPVSGFTHLFGAVLSLVGMVWLIWLARDYPGRAVALGIFGLSMVLVYSASTIMHLYNGSKKMIHRLNQLDHSAIYVMIAGTYTPFTYTFLTDVWRWGLLSTIWGLAIVGIILKLGFNMYGHVSTLFYVLMGWIAVIGFPQFINTDFVNALGLVVAGGLTYTIGAVIFAIKRPNFHEHFGYHEVWHLFVLAGSAFHFAAAVLWVAQ